MNFRKAILRLFILSALLCLTFPVQQNPYAHAETQEGATGQAPTSLSWDALEKITFEEYEAENEVGQKFPHNRALYPEDIAALDGKMVFMSGYLYPYELDDTENTFFWGPYSMTCPYCDGLSPSLLSAITFKNHVEHTYDKVTVMGRLELSNEDFWGIYYRLKDAIILIH